MEVYIISSRERPQSAKRLLLPKLGLGCAALGNLYEIVQEQDAHHTIDAARAAGITYFDVAPLYGHGLAELRLGAGLRRCGGTDSIISTKVGWRLHPAYDGCAHGAPFRNISDFTRSPDYSYDATMRSLEGSMHRLGRSRIDIVFIHDVDTRTHGDLYPKMFGAAMRGAYLALDELRAAGVIQAIGIGVSEWEPCVEFAAEGEFDCFLVAGRYTLLEQDAIQTLLPLCERRQIDVIVGGVYNSGILAGDGISNATYDYKLAPEHILKRVHGIRRLCAAHGIDIKAAALQFSLLHPSVVSVIPGARSAHEVSENVKMLGLPVPLSFWQEMMDEGFIRDDVPI